MPSIWKAFSRPKAELYQFPEASGLPEEGRDDSFEPLGAEAEALEQEMRDLAREAPEPQPPEPEPEPEPDPIEFARIQAEEIVADARRQAEEILEKAQAEAMARAEEIYENARQSGQEAGRAEGVIQGVAQAMEEGHQTQERQAAALEAQVADFLERASAALDRQLEDNVEELRDLALAIAEKVVCVSLKSSSEVICRMIQTAIDKRKHREWVHIYIAECDAKHLTKIPQALTAALSALSDRVRIIPMADDEAGTCIIETPDEIVDASAATQIENIRTLLADAPSAGFDGSLNFGRGIGGS